MADREWVLEGGVMYGSSLAPDGGRSEVIRAVSGPRIAPGEQVRVIPAAEAEALVFDMGREIGRLREAAIEGGACWCTWDIDGDGKDYIESSHAECPVHAVTKEESAE